MESIGQRGIYIDCSPLHTLLAQYWIHVMESISQRGIDIDCIPLHTLLAQDWIHVMESIGQRGMDIDCNPLHTLLAEYWIHVMESISQRGMDIQTAASFILSHNLESKCIYTLIQYTVCINFSILNKRMVSIVTGLKPPLIMTNSYSTRLAWERGEIKCRSLNMLAV